MEPILLVQPDNGLEHAFADEIARIEGLFHFRREKAADCDTERLRAAPLAVLLAGAYADDEAGRCAEYVRQGGRALAICPSGHLAQALGVTARVVQSTQKDTAAKRAARRLEGEADSENPLALEDAGVVVRPGAGLPEPPEPLFCPGPTSQSMDCEGEVLADLVDRFGKRRGPAIVRRRHGRGQLVVLAYDLVGAVLRLRHGTWDLDQRPEMFPLRGPRHINGFVGVAEHTSRQVPLGDVHQDLFRELVLSLLAQPLYPRIWHLPDAASVAVFVKSDGCGEEGAPVGIELAERYGHRHNFFQGPDSQFDGPLLREWHERGHAMSIEVDITHLTYARKAAELGAEDHRQFRDLMESHAHSFRAATGLDFDTMVIHGCQWSGAPMARILVDNGWHMPYHFCSHDPRMGRSDFGPYSVGSGLPMRYFDPDEGLLDLFLQPCCIDDSQSITEEGVGVLGLSQTEYAETLAQAVVESRQRWHVPVIGTFHPCYLIRPQGDPRRTFEAASIFYATMAAQHIELGNLEAWYCFVRGRDALQVEALEDDGQTTRMRLFAPLAVEGLTIVAEGPHPVSRILVDGREQAVQLMEIEGRRRSAACFSLGEGQRVEVALVP